MPGWGKDGSFYKDNNELRRADNKWLQQEEQRKALEKQNKFMQEQNQAVEYQNRLVQEQINQQRKIDEENKILEIRRQLELEKQTLIEKERFFIETLDDNQKSLYSEYKEILDKENRILEKAIDIQNECIDNESNTILDLQQKLQKVCHIGFWKLILKFLILGVLIALIIYWGIFSYTKIGETIFIISLLSYSIYGIVDSIIYNKRHHNANNLYKDINNLSEKYDTFNKIEEIEEIEYIHQIGFEGIGDYVNEANQYCKKILEIEEQISKEIERINNEIDKQEDILNSIYKKRKVDRI